MKENREVHWFVTACFLAAIGWCAGVLFAKLIGAGQ